MANLKVLKSRIKSVKSTQKITKAMKMVAASRLKKAKHAVESSRPYSENIRQMAEDLASNISVKDSFSEKFPLLTGKGEDKSYMLLVLSSDRGLCGGLNSATVRFTKIRINNLVAEGKKVHLICVGKKAYEQLKGNYGNKIVDHIFGVFKNQIDFKVAQDLTTKLIERFDKNEFDICEIIYSKFKSAIAQEPILQQMIPAKINIVNNSSSNNGIAEMPIDYEPNQEEVLSNLLPKNIAIQIYKNLLENSASEQGARMAAMEAASTNANKMIKNLTLVYNRTRQANITRELIDIVSGANAV